MGNEYSNLHRGNELRYFFASEKKLLGESGRKPEIRSDYYIVATEDIGLKFRGGRGLEMKVRTHRKELGVETWEKHHIGNDISLQNVTFDTLSNALQAYANEPSLAPLVQAAISSLRVHGVHIVAAHKERVQATDASGISREMTRVVLQAHRTVGADLKQETPRQLDCYTYCAEGGAPDDLWRQCASDKVNGGGGGGGGGGKDDLLANVDNSETKAKTLFLEPMGYPECIYRFHNLTLALNS
jgi:hypothetical protein